MKNHPDSSEQDPHNRPPSTPAAFEPTHPERYAAARNSTWASILINLLLTLLQVIAGYFGRSQSLMADGLHSFSDLLADVMVLFANRHGNRGADARHPYGHARIETAATLILGAVLTALGISLLVAAAMRLQHPASVQPVHPVTFWVALIALAAKEGMFRYMLAVAMRVRSQMLIANAWHARSDAASSLVVLAGIGGNLLGFTFLDLAAAAVVGMIIAHMGGKFALQALAELIDTGLDAEEVAAIRKTLLSTPGVRDLHDLRTRKMADNALVDAHIMVDPHISVSEGHYIAETARQSVLRNHEVMDVMVHIDPEDDATSRPNVRLPSRDQLRVHLEACMGEPLPDASRLVLHYLDGRVEAEVHMDQNGAWSDEKINSLRAKCGQLSATDPYFRSIRLYKHIAP
jgi:cation diffusion facilitator family transporter